MTVKITPTLLARLGATSADAAKFADPLTAVLNLHGIDTPKRAAAFLGQCAVESANFSRLKEGLYYTTMDRLVAVYGRRVAGRTDLLRNPRGLANVVYANRLGNGSEASGDGWRYIGRGLIMNTGKHNYTKAAEATGRPYVEQPELLEQPSDAALAAAVFWRDNHINRFADAWNLVTCTELVNGKAKLHLAERIAKSERALATLVANTNG